MVVPMVGNALDKEDINSSVNKISPVLATLKREFF